MRLPFKAAAAFIASPQGRRAIKRARERYDTPENRERAAAAFKELRTRLAKGKDRPAPRGNADRPPARAAGLP